MAETLLPPTPSSAPRIETGTMATSGPSGRASCASNHRRRAPALIAMTTSLTDTSKVFLTNFTSSSRSEAKANRRCGEMATLSGVGGATRGVEDLMTPPSPDGPATEAEQVADERPHDGCDGRDGADPVDGQLRHLDGSPGQPPDRLHPEPGGTGSGLRPKLRRRSGRRRLRAEASKSSVSISAPYAVDRGVVQFGADRHPATGQPTEQVGLPEQALPIQRTRMDP